MSTIAGILAKPVFSALAVALLSGCVATELSVPNDHPGSLRARSGQLPALTDLRAELDAAPEGPTTPNAAHRHGTDGTESKQGAEVRYTCPMHPEIERSEPGTCPKCGMKLVPKQGKP